MPLSFDPSRAKPNKVSTICTNRSPGVTSTRTRASRSAAFHQSCQTLGSPQHITLQEYRDTIDETERRIARVTEQLRQLAPTWRWAPVVAALQALRGVWFLTAVALVAELGDLTRFGHPRELMAYLGLVPSEHSSGPSVRRDHEGGQSPRPPVARGSGVGVSRDSPDWTSACVSAGSAAQGGVRHRAEGPTSIDDALPAAGRARESEAQSRYRNRARAHGFHLGDCAGGGAGVAVAATRVHDVFVHRSFRRYGDQVENPRGR